MPCENFVHLQKSKKHGRFSLLVQSWQVRDSGKELNFEQPFLQELISPKHEKHKRPMDIANLFPDFRNVLQSIELWL